MSDREWIEVVSSNIKAVSYFKKNQELRIRFKNDSEYVYYQVPKTLFDDMINAESVGKFLNDFVKPNYQYEREV